VRGAGPLRARPPYRKSPSLNVEYQCSSRLRVGKAEGHLTGTLTLKTRINRFEACFGVGCQPASAAADGPVATEEQLAAIIAAIRAGRLALRRLMTSGEYPPALEESAERPIALRATRLAA
jgi:hypothetical protein